MKTTSNHTLHTFFIQPTAGGQESGWQSDMDAIYPSVSERVLDGVATSR
jgi:hypothetical protein